MEKNKKESKKVETKSQKIVEKPFAKHINIEKPKLLSESDLYGTYQYVDILKKELDSNNKSIAILGKWGKGKSSLVQTMKKEKEQEIGNKFVFREFDVWRYAKDDFRKQLLYEIGRNYSSDERLKNADLSSAESWSDLFNDKNISKEKNKIDMKNAVFLGLEVALSIASSYLIIEGVSIAKYVVPGIAGLTFALHAIYKILDKKIKHSTTTHLHRISVTADFVPIFEKIVEQYEAENEKLIIILENLDRLDDSKYVKLVLDQIKTLIDLDKKSVVKFIVPIDYDTIFQQYGFRTQEFLDKAFDSVYSILNFDSANNELHIDGIFNEYAETKFFAYITKDSEQFKNIKRTISNIFPNEPRSHKRLIKKMNDEFDFYTHESSKKENQVITSRKIEKTFSNSENFAYLTLIFYLFPRFKSDLFEKSLKTGNDIIELIKEINAEYSDNETDEIVTTKMADLVTKVFIPQIDKLNIYNFGSYTTLWSTKEYTLSDKEAIIFYDENNLKILKNSYETNDLNKQVSQLIKDEGLYNDKINANQIAKSLIFLNTVELIDLKLIKNINIADGNHLSDIFRFIRDFLPEKISHFGGNFNYDYNTVSFNAFNINEAFGLIKYPFKITEKNFMFFQFEKLGDVVDVGVRDSIITLWSTVRGQYAAKSYMEMLLSTFRKNRFTIEKTYFENYYSLLDTSGHLRNFVSYVTTDPYQAINSLRYVSLMNPTDKGKLLLEVLAWLIESNKIYLRYDFLDLLDGNFLINDEVFLRFFKLINPGDYASFIRYQFRHIQNKEYLLKTFIKQMLSKGTSPNSLKGSFAAWISRDSKIWFDIWCEIFGEKAYFDQNSPNDSYIPTNIDKRKLKGISAEWKAKLGIK